MNVFLLPFFFPYYWQTFALKYAVDAFQIVISESQHNLRYYTGK